MSIDPSDGFGALSAELAAQFSKGLGRWPEERFDAIARRVFAWQWEHNPVYQRFCAAKGCTPDSIADWTRIPAVPTAAFKAMDLAVGPSEATFRTSGTSRGETARGRHGVRSLALYRAASLPMLETHLVPDGGPIRILSLIPEADAVPDSSLARMMSFAADEFGDGAGGSFAGPDSSLDLRGFAKAAATAAAEGVPVWVAGTAFAFVHWIDAVARGEVGPIRLPEGSRAMETGGFKGRSRTVSKEELYEGIESTLGIGAEWVVNEYGMTELLSQFYDGVAGAAGRRPAVERRHRAPPWLRTRVVDPVTLDPVRTGDPGLLFHFDLANLGSVSAVLTEDLGVMDDEGIRLLGRAAGAEPRGCSLSLEELLEARASGSQP